MPVRAKPLIFRATLTDVDSIIATVPVAKTWVIRTVELYNAGPAPTDVVLYAARGATSTARWRSIGDAAIASDVGIVDQVRRYLQAGDEIRGRTALAVSPVWVTIYGAELDGVAG